MVEFRVLGPVEVEHIGRPVDVGRRRERCLLGILLLHAGTAVPVARLIDLLWDGEASEAARAAVRVHVSRLRSRLGTGDALPVRSGDGYLMRVEPESVDALRFRGMVEQARGIVPAAERAALLRQALGLWRGPLLADAASDRLRDRIGAPWTELRLAALEAAIESELECGRHRELVGELTALTAEHPERERFTGMLMLALYRSARQAEALEVFARRDRWFREELGLDPGPELRELHQRILASDPDLLADRTSSQPATPTNGLARIVPRQLPAAVRHFTGRAAELKVLSELLPESAAGGAVVISAIDGTAGIGKTALAVHWAHQAAPRFPDGQLYVNLRGFDPSGTPMASAEAMRRFLDALDVPPRRIPADPDEQAALYRSQLADRRVLIVLDNARDVEQVRALLPGSPGCLVLVTSRNQLGGLVALEGAVPLTLDLLTKDEARDLLIRRLGHERVLADEQAVAELIEACARLPLALNIAAARATLHPARPLSELVDQLRDARRRLDALTTGEDAADMRAVFSWSYHTLNPAAARVFRLLSAHPGPDISLPAAASLTALEPDRTRRALDELTRAHLITEHAPGRYTIHDLLRTYAAEQAHTHDSQDERHDALRRVCDFYLHTAHTADRVLAPHRPPLRLEPPAPGTRPRPLRDAPAAMAWFDAEHPHLLAAQHTAATHAWHPIVWQLAWTLTTYHARRGHRHDELVAWQAALDAAAHLPDPAARTLAHRLLGRAHANLGRHDEAIGHLHEALALAEHQHDPTDQAHTHRLLAWAWEVQGDDRQALQHATCALNLFRTLDQPTWQANTHNIVGWLAAHLGDYDTARTHCQTALALHRRHGDPNGEALTLDSLGYIEHHTDHHHQAINHYQEALALFRSLGNSSESANTLDNLGRPHAALGQHQQARTTWRQALELYQQQGRTQDAERVQRQLDTLDQR